VKDSLPGGGAEHLPLLGRDDLFYSHHKDDEKRLVRGAPDEPPATIAGSIVSGVYQIEKEFHLFPTHKRSAHNAFINGLTYIGPWTS